MAPNLSEIAATTQRGRKMPSETPKMAKTMSAIAHGWKPKGSAAGIPVKVAKEFHAADRGKKWGKGHDQTHQDHRAPHHSPAGIANNDGFTGKLEGHFTGKGAGQGSHPFAGHRKQPHGEKGKEMVGFADARHGTGHDSFAGEQKEHWGNRTGPFGTHDSTQKEGSRSAVGHTRGKGEPNGHSRLAEKSGMAHAKQPHRGDSTGAGRNDVAEHHVGHTMHGSHAPGDNSVTRAASPHTFRDPMGGEAHGYRHSSYQRDGVLRNSGHKGAHRIGRR